MDENLIVGIIIGILLYWIFSRFMKKEAEPYKLEPSEINPDEAKEKLKNLVSKLAEDIKKAKEERKSKEEIIKISNDFHDSMNETQKAASAWKIRTEI